MICFLYINMYISIVLKLLDIFKMIERKIVDQLRAHIDTPEISLVVWPRQVGKTTAIQQLRSWLTEYTTTFLSLEDPLLRRRLDEHPEYLYEATLTDPKSKQIVFIDEIQLLANPTNFLKYHYDTYKWNVKLIVTGSSSFYIDKKFRDSLAGRKKIFHLSSCDFFEFLSFKGEEWLRAFLEEKKQVPEVHRIRIERYLEEYVTYGGYPHVILTEDIQEKKLYLRQYTYDLIKKDFQEAWIKYEDHFFQLFQILASQIGELVNKHELANSLDITQPTIDKYIYLLQKSFHISLIQPFYTNKRKELTKMAKIYFHDLGVRNALLRDFRSWGERTDKWAILENLFFAITMGQVIYSDDIQYWRTQAKQEVDFVIEQKKAYECKYNNKKITLSKYTSFTNAYPDIPLNFITYENILTYLVTSW